MARMFVLCVGGRTARTYSEDSEDVQCTFLRASEVFSCGLEELYVGYAVEKFKMLGVLSVGPARLKFSLRGDPSAIQTRGNVDRAAYYASCWEKVF